jgi:hypothetical protein
MFAPVRTNQAFGIGALYLLEGEGHPATLVLVRVGGTKADGDLDLSLGSRGGLAGTVDTLKLSASLFCCYPDAGPTSRATKTPPIFMH